MLRTSVVGLDAAEPRAPSKRVIVSRVRPRGSAHEHPFLVTSRYYFVVVNVRDPRKPDPNDQTRPPLPQPSPQYWRRAWVEFQRALDPLAPQKQLPPLPWDKTERATAQGRRFRGRV
jgi:hypothetical protein